MSVSPFISLAQRLADPATQGDAKQALELLLGVDEFLIFLPEPALEVMLPAPGFPQTLPAGARWAEFVRKTAKGECVREVLPSPRTQQEVQVVGQRATDGSVLALLGGNPDSGATAQFLELMPLVVMALRAELAVRAATGQTQALRSSALQSHRLTLALDRARKELQETLSERNELLQKSESAYQSLEESQARLRFALEAARMGEWSYDLLRGTASVSVGHAKCFGFDSVPEAWSFQTFRELIHPSDRQRVEGLWMSALEGTGDYDVDYRVIWKDQSVHWLSSKGRVIRDARGVATHVVGVVSEITEQKELEASLRNAIQLRDEFLSIASHELRTPVTAMKLQTQAMIRNLGRGDPLALSPDRIAKLLSHVDSGLARLTRLIEDMLDISNLQSGQLRFSFAHFDLVSVLEDALDRFQPLLTSAGIQVSVEGKCSMAVKGDPFRLEQVIVNILTNAIRYAPNGPLTVSCRHQGGTVAVSFRDQGPGIAPGNHSRIFQRFERLVTASEVSGLGLGLYISKEIVAAHGGSLTVNSELGRGATFTVSLPRSAPV